MGAIGSGCPASRTDRPDREPAAGTPQAKEEPRGNLQFVAQELPFRYERGESGAAWPVEVTGGGVAIFDFDNDGDLDLFFPQGQKLPVGSDPNPPGDVLLRNDGLRRFSDISSAVGLSAKGYGQGVEAADYDGDGDIDLYVTRYGKNTLWRHEGSRFTDATDEAGVGCDSWSLGAAFFDADGDGDLDLFVANYLAFDPADTPFERTPDGQAEYGAPAKFEGLRDVLYRNEGNGRFTDITDEAGVGGKGRGMGVVAAALGDGGPCDIVVANDAEPNAVWRRTAQGRYEEVATRIGLDVNGKGVAEANMGLARGDVDGDGIQDVLITHFVNEHDTLWRGLALPDGGVLFSDATYEAGLGTESLPYTGWGAAFADFDHDGALDLVVTNGHIRKEAAQKYAVANPPLLWRNQGGGRFKNVTSTGGPYFQGLYQGRGLATGDLDNDGDLDVVIVHHKGPSVVLWNETPRRGHWLMFHLIGAGANRDAIGAKIRVEAGGRVWVRSIDGGGSYISASDKRVHAGLGDAPRVDRVDVRWPDGKAETRAGLAVDQVIRWEQDATSR